MPSLGDGYKSVVTFVLDMLSWWFLKQQQEERNGEPTDLSGIVLIDEIEQHLHPKWQRTIISKLVSSFPDVQFITTTHSPLVASGCDDVPVHKINDGKCDIVDPFGWLAEDVYRIMGLEDGTRAKKFRPVIEEFRELDLKRISGKATKSDTAKLNVLKKEMDQLPGSDPLQLLSTMENIRKSLEEVPK